MTAPSDLERAAAAMPSARLIRGDAVKLEPVRWLCPGLLPEGMLTVLGGPPGCGKTTIALSLGAAVTSAGYWPSGARCREAGDVVIWSGEDAPSVLAARLIAAGADMRRVQFVDGVNGEGDAGGNTFDPGRDIALLEVALSKLDAPRLLILDPIVSAVTGDGHKSNDVRRSLQPVVALAQRLKCAVIGITHFTKGTAGSDPVERITGSVAYAALARMVLVASKMKAEGNEEPARVLMRAKCNVGPDTGGYAYTLERLPVAPDVEGQCVAWGDPIEGSARDVLAEAEAAPEAEAPPPEHERSALDDAMDFLREVLSDGPVSKLDIEAEAKAAGQAMRTVRRAKDQMGVKAFKTANEWRWKLPEEAKTAKGAKASTIPEPGEVGHLGHLGTLGRVADDAEAY